MAIAHLADGEPILKSDTVAEMRRPHGDGYCKDPRRYGLGFDLETHGRLELVTHGGGSGPYGSSFVLVPEEKLAVVLLFNGPGGHGVRSRDVLDLILGDTGPAPPVAPPDPTRWPAHAGVYENPHEPNPVLPATLEIVAAEEGPVLRLGDTEHPLRALDEPVYEDAAQTLTVGFVPEPTGPTRYLMLNRFPIGLVSAQPYRRVS